MPAITVNDPLTLPAVAAPDAETSTERRIIFSPEIAGRRIGSDGEAVVDAHRQPIGFTCDPCIRQIDFERQVAVLEVAEMSYSALRVSRIEDGDDEMIVWVASGVPTPIRIVQRDGDDTIDLRLTEYRGAE